MKITDFFLGKFSHKFWKNNLCLGLIAEFLGTLLLAWAIRPVCIDSSWRYIPFQNYISTLGWGRGSVNMGAWVFLIGFCLFPIIGTAWNSYLARQFAKVSTVSKIFSILLWIIFEFSMICVAFVGIFDGIWPNPAVSAAMHTFGAIYSFLGHTLSAVLVFVAISVIYWTTSKDFRKKQMRHPVWFFLVIVELVGVYLIFDHYGGAFWQWMIMLSLNIFLFAISRLMPENMTTKEL